MYYHVTAANTEANCSTYSEVANACCAIALITDSNEILDVRVWPW